MIIGFALVMFGTCLAILALEDALFFEIKLEVLPLLAGLSFVLATHFGIARQDSLMGGVIWGGFPLLIRALGFRMVGQGDLWLLATAGLFVGLRDLAATTVLLGALIFMTAALYARLRGKPGLRSIVPLAVPLALTLFLLLGWRLFGAGFDESGLTWVIYAQIGAPLLGIGAGIFLYDWHLERFRTPHDSLFPTNALKRGTGQKETQP